MHVLIVVESCFGNTAAIADAIAAGLRGTRTTASVVAAANAPAKPDADLVLVGAPTHNLGLPSSKSRAQAVARGGHAPASGVAEWLARRPELRGVRSAAFDTAVPGAFSGSAAKRIERALRGLKADVVGRESFRVAGTPPALAAGEQERAQAWVVSLGGA